MAKCNFCEKEMTKAASCIPAHLVIDGQSYQRERHVGEERLVIVE